MPFAGFGDAVTVRPSPLPVDLGPGPFSTAGARLLGVPPERLRRSDLVHPTRGAHMLVEPETLVERALAFQVAMPGDRAFSHVTAALLWGLPLPRALEQLATAEGAPLHVMAPTRDGMVHLSEHTALEQVRIVHDFHRVLHGTAGNAQGSHCRHHLVFGARLTVGGE